MNKYRIPPLTVIAEDISKTHLHSKKLLRSVIPPMVPALYSFPMVVIRNRKRQYQRNQK